MIAERALDAAGIPVFLHSGALLTVDPGYTIAVGGFRLLVCDEDLEAAIAVLEEARRNPLREGESLDVELNFVNGVLSFVVGGVCAAPAPIRNRRWRAAPV